MSDKMVDVTLHINENISHNDREFFRDSLLNMNGVMAADCRDDKPHLVLIGYNPDTINSINFVKVAKEHSLHAQLVGL
ncbi:MAG: ATP-binding protein [Halobacteria archaeon]|nr:ATP-binding protein [Halobacteria archaeon]